MRIHYLQHVSFEGPANIAVWSGQRGHDLRGSALFDGEKPPEVGDFDWLIVMGGPMSVHDEDQYPWLTAEKGLIGRTVQAGKRVLGICLGAQLLAQSLGARVYRNPFPEIGWFAVRAGPDAAQSPLGGALPSEFPAFHWHGEAFDLPADALHLASSEATAVQAFAHGSALGLLCHLEGTRASVAAMIAVCDDDIGSGPFEQRREQLLAESAPFDSLKDVLWRVLDCMAEPTFGASRSPDVHGDRG